MWTHKFCFSKGCCPYTAQVPKELKDNGHVLPWSVALPEARRHATSTSGRYIIRTVHFLFTCNSLNTLVRFYSMLWLRVGCLGTGGRRCNGTRAEAAGRPPGARVVARRKIHIWSSATREGTFRRRWNRRGESISERPFWRVQVYGIITRPLSKCWFWCQSSRSLLMVIVFIRKCICR